MTRENFESDVEVIRRCYDAWNAGDADALLAEVDADFEMTLPQGGINAGTYRGRESVSTLMAGYYEAFEQFEMAPEEYLETGDGVLVLLEVRTRGRESGLEVTLRPAHLWTMRAGKMARLRLFTDRSVALEAAGVGG